MAKKTAPWQNRIVGEGEVAAVDLVPHRALEQMTRLAAEFGMTPSSRSRVRVAEKDTGPSLADILFGDAIDKLEPENE